MHLRHALGDVQDVDPTRPLVIGGTTLGVEAAAEAASILTGAVQPPAASILLRDFRRPVYWSIDHSDSGHADLFGFPVDWQAELPTAVEVAIVRAISALPPEQHPAVLAGGAEIVLGSEDACGEFRKLARAAESPMAGEFTEFDQFSSAAISPSDGRSLRVAVNCMLNSYATSPLKFRFLELYRVMEALFLADVKSRLMANFDAEPADAVNEALEALKSELRQITALAEPYQELFEEFWIKLDALKNANKFATALFRRVAEKKISGKWKTGAALIYQIRCAVVHAGEKDMIFENFPDGDATLKEVILPMERAALRMLGITLG